MGPDGKLHEIRKMPGPRGFPLLGNLHQIRIDQLHLILEKWAEIHGPIYRFRLGPEQVVVISDCDNIQEILARRPDGFRRTRLLERVAEDMRLNGVFVAEGDDWRRQRRIVAAALGRARITGLFPGLNVVIGRLLHHWQHAADGGRDVDPCHDLMRVTVDFTMKIAFGVDANTLETDGPVIQRHFDRVLPILFKRINLPFAYWQYFKLPSDRALDRSLRDLESEVGVMVHNARQRLEQNPELRTNPSNFLEAIHVEVESGDSGFSDSEIFANAGTLLIAGEDTTAYSIAWAIHFLTLYPDHFKRIREETDMLLGSALLIEDLAQTGKLPVLDAFCKEVMRLRPVAPLYVLEPVEDTQILGYRIPRGSRMMMPIRRMATQNAYFADADRFNPDRWLSTTGSAHCPHDTRAYVPFGSGPRVCPGRSLAMLQIRTVLTMLCRNFDLEAIKPASEIGEHLALTMMPTNLKMRLSRRTIH